MIGLQILLLFVRALTFPFVTQGDPCNSEVGTQQPVAKCGLLPAFVRGEKAKSAFYFFFFFGMVENNIK